MEKLKQYLMICERDHAVGSWIFLLTTIFLFIGAALTPPLFIIDKSILAASGILFAFATLWRLPNLIRSIQDGRSVKFSAGGVDVTVASDKEKEEEN